MFEVSYLVDVIEKTLFDTIYHEHLDYHTVQPLVGFFERCGLELIDAIRVDTHGGSLRGVVKLRGRTAADRAPRSPRSSSRERRMGLRQAGSLPARSRRTIETRQGAS